MLHDMVAAHSIVRVTVCRANNGLSIYFLFLCFYFLLADGLCIVILIVVHSMYHFISKSAFQTIPDSSSSLLLCWTRHNYTVTLLWVSSRSLLGWDNVGLERERECVC